MRKQSGVIFPTNRKGTWVIVTKGEKKAFVATGPTRTIAAKKFFDSRQMRMTPAKRRR